MTNKKPKAPSIHVRRARISFLWAEVLPDMLAQQVPTSSQLAFLTRSFLFSKAFEKYRDGAAQAIPLQTPWVAEHRQQFWMRYLVQGKLAEVPGKQAWEYFVPLRQPDSYAITAEGIDGTFYIDSFYYPFGIATAITCRWDANLPLADFLARASQLSKGGAFTIAGEPGPLSLEALADRDLTRLRKLALGDASVAGYRSPQPFSILTIIEAAGVDPAAKVKKNNDILRALEVLTNWPGDWKYLNLPDPEKVCLPIKQSAPPGSALYAEERGRAVWHPAMFRADNSATVLEAVDQSRRSSKLSCYHRNLFFASLQTESLGRLVAYTAQQFAAGKRTIDLTPSHRDMAANAARSLVKLYLGDKGNTWRSASMQRQIDQTFRKDLEAVLAQFPVATLPALPATPSAPAPANAPAPAI